MNRVINNIKTLGIFAIMFALVASLAGAGSASASSLVAAMDEPPVVMGQVVLKVGYFPLPAAPIQATVEFFTEQGQPAAKTLTNASGEASVQLPEGLYKVRISARGYNTYSQYVKVSADAVTYLKVALYTSMISAPRPATH